jgi:hypothetical protein
MEIKLILLKCQVLTDVLAFARATMLVHVKGLKQPGKKIHMYVAQTLQPIFYKKYALYLKLIISILHVSIY